MELKKTMTAVVMAAVVCGGFYASVASAYDCKDGYNRKKGTVSAGMQQTKASPKVRMVGVPYSGYKIQWTLTVTDSKTKKKSGPFKYGPYSKATTVAYTPSFGSPFYTYKIESCKATAITAKVPSGGK